jgi:hypothetical protein
VQFAKTVPLPGSDFVGSQISGYRKKKSPECTSVQNSGCRVHFGLFEWGRGKELLPILHTLLNLHRRRGQLLMVQITQLLSTRRMLIGSSRKRIGKLKGRFTTQNLSSKWPGVES